MKSYNGNNNGKSVVNRVQGVFANLVRERDEWHRKNSLATERLRLAREEKDSFEKTVISEREQLAKLQADASGDNAKELDELKQKAEKKLEEANFQHNELLRKQQKVESLRRRMEERKAGHDKSLRTQNESIHKIRDKIEKSSTQAPMAPQAALEALKIEMSYSGPRLLKEFPRILREHTAKLKDETMKLQRSNADLERILEGYKKNYGHLLK